MHLRLLLYPRYVLLLIRTFKQMNHHFTLFCKQRALCLLLVAALFPNAVFAEKQSNEAMDLLNRMHHSLNQLNYKGTLVYKRGNSLSTLHIDHSIVNGVRRERVVRLNDQGGEVSRELKGFSLSSIPVIRPHMEKVYSFDMGRENRVANIPCRIITARPKDRVRYLQKYCIDPESGMLLDYMLVGKTHKPVEQFMFTSIEFSHPEGSEKNAAKLGVDNNIVESLPLDIELQMNAAEPVLLDKAVTAVLKNSASSKPITIEKKARLTRQISSNQLDDGWVMEHLPVGFEIMQAPSMKPSPDDEGVTKHYVVSDGLSSLSVFVSPLSDSSQPRDDAIQVNSGALNMISQKKHKHIITVVGEVPKSTLEKVVNSLRKNTVK